MSEFLRSVMLLDRPEQESSEYEVSEEDYAGTVSRDQLVDLVQELKRVLREAREVGAALAATDYDEDFSLSEFELRSTRAVIDFVRPEEDFGSGVAGE